MASVVPIVIAMVAVAAAAVAIVVAARRTQLNTVLVLAIALKGFAIRQGGALRFSNARCGNMSKAR